MKILSVVTYYHPHWTGLTAHARQAAEGLAARGHEVTVLTHRHEPSLPREERIAGVRVVRLSPLGRISRGMVSLEFPAAASRLVAENDVVQVHTPMLEALAVALFCRLRRRPLVMTHHGDLVMPAGALNRTVERLVAAEMTLAGRLADAVTSYSRDYAENSDFLAPFAEKLFAIAPPVAVASPDPERVARWRRELALDGKKVVGFAGRFVEEKGFDFLLRAIPRILEKEPTARFLYAGEPNVVYEKFYERCQPLLERVRDHVTFLGLLREPERLANFYAMCEVFALPSRTDCLALVQIEAMLCGTPVVASDVPGARVPVRETGMGRLVRPFDPQALADAILAVLADPAAYRRPREVIRAAYDTERTLDGYEELFQTLVRDPRRRRVGDPGVATAAHLDTGSVAPLGEQQAAVVETCLRNEADMAYRRRARRLVEYLELRPGDAVFDCGCGMGFYLLLLGRIGGFRLVGCDGDRERLRLARREGVPASLLVADLESQPFRDASFDKILMSEVLEHVADDRRALAEAYRLLRPGGVLAISVPHANYPLLWDPFNGVWTAIGGRPIRTGPLVGMWTHHRRLYWPRPLAERVAEAGFEIEVVEEATHSVVPFGHFLVYGVGKPLLERGLLPERWRRNADRMSGERGDAGPWHPLSLARRFFRWVDRRNDRPAASRRRTFVNVLVKARKPPRAAASARTG